MLNTRPPCQAQAEAEELGRRMPGVRHLLSVTIESNAAMRRCFARRGFQQQRPVVAWPTWPVAHAAAEQLGQAAWQAELQQQSGERPPSSFLEALPAARAAVKTAAAASLLPHWRRCESVAELEAALLHQRRHAVEAAEGAAAAAQPPATSHAFHWVPAEYELLPAGGDEARQLVEQGRVWLLRGPEEQAAAAVLVCYEPNRSGGRRAGIVAGSAAALEAALLHANEAAPLVTRFFVDCVPPLDGHERLWEAGGGDRGGDVLPHWKPL